MQRIHKIGVEIEGGWNTGNVPAASPGNCGVDGSVSFSETGVVGHEFVSAPYTNLLELTEWIRRVYPPHTNSTCGLHVHFSFKSSFDYGRVIDKRFGDYFHEQMTEWAKRAEIKNKHFYARLSGENHFCKREWKPEPQMKATGKDSSCRYCQWNFCWGIRKTAECRMLPTFKNVNVAIAAVTQLVKVVEGYLQEQAIAFAVTETKYGQTGELPPELVQMMVE